MYLDDREGSGSVLQRWMCAGGSEAADTQGRDGLVLGLFILSSDKRLLNLSLPLFL